MTTKDYPLDIIKALHLLTGDGPVELEMSDGDRVKREDGYVLVAGDKYSLRHSLSNFAQYYKSHFFRTYEPPKPPKPSKLEPVELCQEVLERYEELYGRSMFGRDVKEFYGTLIAQAVSMAREEREAEKGK